jgi:metacaspase-1
MAKRKPVYRAACLGINKFLPSTGAEQLDGCVNDVLLGYKIWKEIYGFTEFQVLTNEEVTKANFRKTLDWLVNDLPEGSKIILQVSSHGTHVPVTSQTANTDIDGVDECVVTYDFDFQDPLRDNDLGEKFKSLDPSIHVFVMMDCCMSGTGLRCLPGNKTKNRYVKPPPSMILHSGQIDLTEDLDYLIGRNTADSEVQQTPFLINTLDQGNAILLSSCADCQYSADTFIEAAHRYHGVCTYYVAQTLREANWDITYQDLVVTLNHKLHDAGFVNQTPQLECKDCFDMKFLLGPKG